MLDVSAVLELLRQWSEGLAASAAAKESPKEAGYGADDVVALRREYGYKLLAKDADIEALTAELNEAIQERENLQEHLRNVTRTLQRAYEAHDVLHRALYQ